MKLLLSTTPLLFFVNLQEADLQRYRTHLISMGKIENAAGANLKPRRHKTFEESIKAFEVGHINFLYKQLQTQSCKVARLLHTVTCCCCSPSARRPVEMSASSSPLVSQVLPEVLQQQARLDDPGAAARREIIRCDVLTWKTSSML